MLASTIALMPCIWKSIKHSSFLRVGLKKSKGNSKYQKIADSARIFVEKKHTWKNRVAFFVDQVLKLSKI